jgi:hypothetical protein
VYLLPDQMILLVLLIFKSIIKVKRVTDRRANGIRYLRNTSWKPKCIGSFNMDWRILVFQINSLLKMMCDRL